MSRMSSTYGGFGRVLAQMEARRDPFQPGPGEGLPDGDVDLAALVGEVVGETVEPYASSTSNFAYKVRQLEGQFRGQSRLLFLHALLIAHLRRRSQPEHCAVLFLRIWAEQADFLLDRLDPRWLVSALTTFGDHGATEAQRRVGQSLTVLCSTMKLYETERLFSNTPPEQTFAGKRQNRPLPLEMDPYAILNGGLDVNMLGRIWQDAESDPLISPLAHHVLELLDQDSRSIFRRLRLMRIAREEAISLKSEPLFITNRASGKSNILPVGAARQPADSEHPSWGVVATVRGTVAELARFTAYYISQGASCVYLYLDEPDPAVAEIFHGREDVRVIPCDEAYWAQFRNGRPETHQNRQLRNATHCYKGCSEDWLGHFDLDEFLILAPDDHLEELLAAVPQDMAVLKLRPAELLAGGDNTHFKLAPRFAGLDGSVLEEIYPTFGAHLRGGYISHLEGKILARTGLPDARLSLHSLLREKKPVSNRVTLRNGWIAHAHAADWQHFRDKLAFRMNRGSYRKTSDAFQLHDVFKFLLAEEGETGLRQFYDEVCADTPELRQNLERFGMLITHDLKLEERCRSVFGALSEDLCP